MRGERGEGRGPRGPKGPKDSGSKNQAVGDNHLENLEQIEYLLFQSTQGVHFMFDHSDVARVLSRPTDGQSFFTEENMKKVQGLLTGFLDCKSLQAKRGYLDRLPAEDFELLVRSYFQLVDNTILAHSNIRH